MTKNELFLELAKPDENGVSRWVKVTEFVGDYDDLAFGNGKVNIFPICPTFTIN